MTIDRASSEVRGPHPCWRGSARLCGCLLLLVAGCSEFDRHVNLPWSGEDDETAVPKSVTAMWTDTVMYKPGNPGTRGLGGRFHFFGDDSQTPVRVDGTLTVYAFSAENVSKGTMPEKKFVFLPEQIAQHCSESSLGPSYSFWLPWDAVGGPQRQLSLMARFETVTGNVVLSTPAKVVLPGAELAGPSLHAAGAAGAPPPTSPGSPRFEARTVSMEQALMPVVSPRDDESKMSSYAINVPPQFLRRLQGKGTETTPSSLPSNSATVETLKARAEALSNQDSGPAAATASSSPEVRSQSSPENASPPPTPEPSTRSAPSKFPTPAAATTRPFLGRAPRPPLRTAWPSRLPPTPRSQPADSESRSPAAD